MGFDSPIDLMIFNPPQRVAVQPTARVNALTPATEVEALEIPAAVKMDEPICWIDGSSILPKWARGSISMARSPIDGGQYTFCERSTMSCIPGG